MAVCCWPWAAYDLVLSALQLYRGSQGDSMVRSALLVAHGRRTYHFLIVDLDMLDPISI